MGAIESSKSPSSSNRYRRRSTIAAGAVAVAVVLTLVAPAFACTPGKNLTIHRAGATVAELEAGAGAYASPSDVIVFTGEGYRPNQDQIDAGIGPVVDVVVRLGAGGPVLATVKTDTIGKIGGSFVVPALGPGVYVVSATAPAVSPPTVYSTDLHVVDPAKARSARGALVSPTPTASPRSSTQSPSAGASPALAGPPEPARPSSPAPPALAPAAASDPSRTGASSAVSAGGPADARNDPQPTSGVAFDQVVPDQTPVANFDTARPSGAWAPDASATPSDSGRNQHHLLLPGVGLLVLSLGLFAGGLVFAVPRRTRAGLAGPTIEE